MINPDAKEHFELGLAVRQFPGILTWLERWASVEIDALPNVSADAVRLAQGRSQVLKEVVKTFKQAPEMVANSGGARVPRVQSRTPVGA